MELSVGQIKKHALEMRRNIIKMLALAGSGHTAGSLGSADIFATLFLNILRFNTKKTQSKNRDFFVLSAGHLAPAYYAALVEAKLLPRHEIFTLRQMGSRLQGHPERKHLPIVEATSGPLGSGLSEAAGMALSIDKKHFVYCLTGDGELNEGNIWEGVMFAAKYKISNLIVFVDRNNIQLSGESEDIMPMEDLRAKWQAFGWHVQEIDGNNIESIIDSVSLARAEVERPSVIIAHTTPGKGVSFMEDNYLWHGKAPNDDEMSRALEELR